LENEIDHSDSELEARPETGSAGYYPVSLPLLPASSCAAVDDASRGCGLGRRFLLHSPQYRLLSTSASVPDGSSHLPQNKAASLPLCHSQMRTSKYIIYRSMRPESTLGYHISSFVVNADSSNPYVWDLQHRTCALQTAPALPPANARSALLINAFIRSPFRAGMCRKHTAPRQTHAPRQRTVSAVLTGARRLSAILAAEACSSCSARGRHSRAIARLKNKNTKRSGPQRVAQLSAALRVVREAAPEPLVLGCKHAHRRQFSVVDERLVLEVRIRCAGDRRCALAVRSTAARPQRM
jgi:hypothetical protein